MSPRLHLLVVEDEPVQRRLLFLTLRSYGYAVREAANATEALHSIGERTPDIMLLDLGLPDLDGMELLSQLRTEHTFPIIVVTARSEERAVVEALDAGANDYVVKPFRESELMARVRAALRAHHRAQARHEVIVGDLRLDVLERRIQVGTQRVELTDTEFDLMLILASEAGRVVTHQRLLSEVWSAEHTEDVQYLRVFIRKLRSKLEQEPSKPRRIVTALGVGYRLVPVQTA